MKRPKTKFATLAKLEKQNERQADIAIGRIRSEMSSVELSIEQISQQLVDNAKRSDESNFDPVMVGTAFAEFVAASQDQLVQLKQKLAGLEISLSNALVQKLAIRQKRKGWEQLDENEVAKQLSVNETRIANEIDDIVSKKLNQRAG